MIRGFSILEDHTTLMRLEELAWKLGVPIRYESIKPDEEEAVISGGYCRLYGDPVIILNTRATTKDQVQALVKALKHFDLNDVYIRPALRELLEQS